MRALVTVLVGSCRLEVGSAISFSDPESGLVDSSDCSEALLTLLKECSN